MRRCKHKDTAFRVSAPDAMVVICVKCKTVLSPRIKVWNGLGYGKHIYADDPSPSPPTI